MDAIHSFLESLKLVRAQSHLNMTLFPLLASDLGEPDYVTLKEALAEGVVEVAEVTDAGHVPELRLTNRSPRCILILEGEELVGAKQNRMVNVTILVPGETTITIPVSCVEQGRWAYQGRHFDYGDKVTYASLRREHSSWVRENLETGGGYSSDQSRLWQGIAAKASRMAVHAPTGAMADLFEAQRDQLSEYERAFRLVECQVGAIFAINGEVLGLECFFHQATFGRFFQRLVRSYALDALDWQSEWKEQKVSGDSVAAFTEGLEKAKMKAYPSVGLGQSLRFENGVVAGSGLVWNQQVLHLSAFRHREESGDGNNIGYGRFPNRRKRKN